VQSDGQLQDAAAYNRLVIALSQRRAGASFRGGTALDSTEQDKQLTTFFDNTGGGQALRPAIVLAVKRQPGANTVEVSARCANN